MTTTVLVAGATGKQGSKAVATILADPAASNWTIRFITRNPFSVSAQKLVKEGLKAYKADLGDESSLYQALSGVDRAYLVTPTHAGEQLEVGQGKRFIDVAKRAGVKHIVFSSVAGADEAIHVPHFRSKWQIEQHLQKSGIPYTIIRPAGFMDNFPYEPGVKRFFMIGAFYAAAGFRKIKLVSTEDIGVFAGKALVQSDDPVFLNKTITLASGEYGLEELRPAYEKVQGVAPWFASWLPESIVKIFPYEFKQMLLYMKNQGFPEVDYSALRKIHPGLMSFEDYLRSVAPSKSR